MKLKYHGNTATFCKFSDISFYAVEGPQIFRCSKKSIDSCPSFFGCFPQLLLSAGLNEPSSMYLFHNFVIYLIFDNSGLLSSSCNMPNEFVCTRLQKILHNKADAYHCLMFFNEAYLHLKPLSLMFRNAIFTPVSPLLCRNCLVQLSVRKHLNFDHVTKSQFQG